MNHKSITLRISEIVKNIKITDIYSHWTWGLKDVVIDNYNNYYLIDRAEYDFLNENRNEETICMFNISKNLRWLAVSTSDNRRKMIYPT